MTSKALDGDYSARLSRTREMLDKWEIDALLISSPANRRWLSGFTGSAGQLLVSRDRAVLATDFRYWEQAKVEAPLFELFQHRRRPRDQAEFIAKVDARRIGLEAGHVTLSQADALAEIEGTSWIHLPQTLELLREVKSADETEAIRSAAAITDRAMAQVHRLARPGKSEKSLAWELEKFVREAGADGLAFPAIIASGPNSALPHHHPGDRKLEIGDALIVDMGAEVHGYKSDLTRTFYVGDEPSAKFLDVYEIVLAAQEHVMAKARAGMLSGEIDALARKHITNSGYGEQFGHGLGHGVGLEIHESPGLTQRKPSSQDSIPAGAILTVEPGIYIPGWAGVRIEDLVRITEDGVEVLSGCPKSPRIAI